MIPFSIGAHPGMLGSFVLMDFPDPADPDLVYIDTMAGDLFVEREADVRRTTINFQHLLASALSPADSLRLIRQRIDAFHEWRSEAMTTPDLANATWRKSSRSSPNGQCTEVADLGDVVGVRDSKDPAGPTLRFSPTAWTTFTASLKHGAPTR